MAYHCWRPGGQMLLLPITAPAHLELVAAASAQRLAALVADGVAQWPRRVPAALQGRRWPPSKQEGLWGLPQAPWGDGTWDFLCSVLGAYCPRPELGLPEGSGPLGEANPLGSKPP